MSKRNITLIVLIAIVLVAVTYLYFKNKNTVPVLTQEQKQQQIMDELNKIPVDPESVQTQADIMKRLNSYKTLNKTDTQTNTGPSQAQLDLMKSLQNIK